MKIRVTYLYEEYSIYIYIGLWRKMGKVTITSLLHEG